MTQEGGIDVNVEWNDVPEFEHLNVPDEAPLSLLIFDFHQLKERVLGLFLGFV